MVTYGDGEARQPGRRFEGVDEKVEVDLHARVEYAQTQHDEENHPHARVLAQIQHRL